MPGNTFCRYPCICLLKRANCIRFLTRHRDKKAHYTQNDEGFDVHETEMITYMLVHLLVFHFFAPLDVDVTKLNLLDLNTVSFEVLIGCKVYPSLQCNVFEIYFHV